MPNRLASERSAYLRSAAHQPVDWHPWGPEAFARARAEHKLITSTPVAVEVNRNSSPVESARPALGRFVCRRLSNTAQ